MPPEVSEGRDLLTVCMGEYKRHAAWTWEAGAGTACVHEFVRHPLSAFTSALNGPVLTGTEYRHLLNLSL